MVETIDENKNELYKLHPDLFVDQLARNHKKEFCNFVDSQFQNIFSSFCKNYFEVEQESKQWLSPIIEIYRLSMQGKIVVKGLKYSVSFLQTHVSEAYIHAIKQNAEISRNRMEEMQLIFFNELAPEENYKLDVCDIPEEMIEIVRNLIDSGKIKNQEVKENLEDILFTLSTLNANNK